MAYMCAVSEFARLLLAFAALLRSVSFMLSLLLFVTILLISCGRAMSKQIMPGPLTTHDTSNTMVALDLICEGGGVVWSCAALAAWSLLTA